ncbi:two-component sensor histidine kinase [Virgibacillus profundi]|uniref:histidine kinase n=1 Tax=Virgibacillus profundi TaxID=2024555 RepID=A0A2A2IGA5_9BACI|nr:HAMP domain-containing histidine kinase [Virgibacillus profundi]PAV30687.1 two-component sensor histidine kinase [Virgibacillus profundi]PXY54859.1 sensor histidine kinase [Virgibacillus profundi]
MKLKTKIQLFSSLFMLVLVLLVNTSAYFLFYKITSDRELEQLTDQTNLLVKTLAENPDISKEETSELIFAYLPTNGMAKVFPEEGQPIEWLYKGENAYNALEGEFSTTESQVIISPVDGVSIAVISKPIIWNNGEIVTLQVSNNLIDFRETMKNLFYVLVIASAIMLIPSVIAGVVLSRFLLNPIKKLIQTMKENTQHAKWQKIDVENRSQDELYEMEQTFNEMIDYLKDNFEKQEIFVSDASHELKTPISIVKSYSQLLERRGIDNPALVKESIEAIDSEADRMQKLVEQMLSLAKNKQIAVMQQVDLVELSEETTNTFRSAYSRQVTFEKSTDSLVVNGNKDQLEQIIYILIDNALKYSKNEVNVKISENNNQVVFKVRDLGKGIPKEEQERIFERFYRMDKARSRDTGGTGLGLAIAKAITNEHRGDLSVTSKMGEGSTFTLRLPLVKES